MDKCKPIDTPIAHGKKLSKENKGSKIDPTLDKRLVSILMYISSTRPDIMYVVSLISIFMEYPKDSHCKFDKRIFRYIARTINFGIWYTSSKDNSLVGYINNDFARDIDDKKNTSSYAFHLRIGLISWASKKYPIVTISSAKEEYVAAISAACHAVWLRRILNDLKHEDKKPTPIFFDKNSGIALSKNHVFHHKSNHINTRYHFIHELVNNGKNHFDFFWIKD